MQPGIPGSGRRPGENEERASPVISLPTAEKARNFVETGDPLAAQVHPADIQDRDGEVPLRLALQAEQETASAVFADSACGGDKSALATEAEATNCPVTVGVVGKPEGGKGFVFLSRRRVVERGSGWLHRCRRLVKDVARSITGSLASLPPVLIRILVRRLGRCEAIATG